MTVWALSSLKQRGARTVPQNQASAPNRRPFLARAGPGSKPQFSRTDSRITRTLGPRTRCAPCPVHFDTPGWQAVSILGQGRKRRLLFERCQNRTISTRQRPRCGRTHLVLSIPRGFTCPPGNLQAGLPSPAALERLTFDYLVGLQPGLGVGIHHFTLPR